MGTEQQQLFEQWWESHGQYLRAGGTEYARSFAYHAWEEASKASPKSEDVRFVGFASGMPGSGGAWTIAVFKASEVPIGTNVYVKKP